MVKGLIVLIVAAAAFIVYALVDCLFTEKHRVRALPRPVWALIVLVLPVIGGLLWFVLGRAPRHVGPIVAPDDDPEFLGRATSRVSEAERRDVDERIRALEDELGERGRRPREHKGEPIEPPASAARPDDDGPSGTLK